MLQIAVVQFSKRPRRANSEKQKNAAKSAKKDFYCIFWGNGTNTSEKVAQKNFYTGNNTVYCGEKYILNVWYIFRDWGKTGCKCHKMGSFFTKKLRAK